MVREISNLRKLWGAGGKCGGNVARANAGARAKFLVFGNPAREDLWGDFQGEAVWLQ